MSRMKKQNSLIKKPIESSIRLSSKETTKRILIVDDDPGIQDIFSIIFEKAGFDLEIKKDGEDLLKNKFTPPRIFLS